MAVPYTFGSATTSIPLSQLDSNFATTITLGNTAVQLGNTITTLTGVTNLASSGALTLGSNGNTTAITVSTSQNVGIGATPTQKLQVAGNVFISSGQYFMWDNAGAWALQSDASTYVRTIINGNEQLRTNAYGIGIGGTTPSSGTGVTFPATQNASSDANTLDDYEEGTWTPSMAFSSGTTGITYSNRSGSYTKIGRAVFITAILQLSNKGSSTGSAQFAGLPFTVASSDENYGGLAIGFIDSITNLGTVLLRTAAGGNFTYISSVTTAGTGTDLTNTNFSNTSFIRFSGVYQTN